MRPSSALFPRKRAAVGLVNLLRKDIDFRRNVVGRSGVVSALPTTESGVGIGSFGCGAFEESLRRMIDFLLLSFGRVGAWIWTTSSPTDPDFPDIDSDFFFFTGEGEREFGLEKDGVQDRRFSLVAKEEALPTEGLAPVEVFVVVAVAADVVDSALVSPGFRLAITRGSAASPFGPPSSANFWRTIFGLFRS